MCVRNPNDIDGKKKQNDKQRASKQARCDGSKRPFVHSWFPFVRV
jgi:hypothetical protein